MMVQDATTDEVAVEQEQQVIVWRRHEPIAGLEHLGRAIVDENGQPSGSPANYENLNGSTGLPALPPLEDTIAAIAAEFPAE